jgi:beta-lactamase class A
MFTQKPRKSFPFRSIALVVLLFGLILSAGVAVKAKSSKALVHANDKSSNMNEVQVQGLPLNMPDSKIFPLRELVDTDLQTKLDKIIASNKTWKSLADSKRIGIGLVDLRNPEQVKFARVNGSHMMYAASLPKIAILLSGMEAIDNGDLEETEEVKADMRMMIAKSSNGAATRMIDRVGFDKIANVMQDPQYEFYDEEMGGGLWVGKRYAQAGTRIGDPMKNLSHAASATQVARFYYLLAFGKLVSQERSKQMLGYLGDPELHHKFVNTLDRVAPRAKVFRKSGSWKNYHSDSALVWGPTWRKYILVALVEDAQGEQIMRQLMAEIDKSLKPAP